MAERTSTLARRRAAGTGHAGRNAGPATAVRSKQEIDQIRQALQERFDELNTEYAHAVEQTRALRRDLRDDVAGDDQADSGAKASDEECELSVVRSLRERRLQAEHALQRLAEGGYGWCEGCGGPIPVERLAVFPLATSCVACKQLVERRAG